MLVFDHSVVTAPPLPSTSPMSLPSSLLPSSPVDHTDADREQCPARGPAGWGGSQPWGRGPWWRGRRPLARGCNARRNKWRGSGWVWARSGHPGALCALLRCSPLPSPPERPPGLLNVRARGGPRPQGPWPPSPGLPGSPPAAPQHTQRKLELPRPLLLPTLLLVALIDWLFLARLMGDSPILISLFPVKLSFFPHLSSRSFSLKGPVVHDPLLNVNV